MPIIGLLQPFLGLGLTVLLGVMLLATIYFTLFDLQWIAFLAGVLFAAVSATASQASKNQWLIARRTKQLQRTKEALTEASADRARAYEAQNTADARLRLVTDALPEMIAYVDREEQCRACNPAFALWSGRKNDHAEGRQLRDAIGALTHDQLKPRIAEVLAGRKVLCETGWRQPGLETVQCTVMLLPFPPDAERPAGFYLVAGGAASLQTAFANANASVPAESVGDVLIVPGDSGGTVYLESMTEQLISGNDPRARLVQAMKEDQFLLFAQKIQPLAPGAGSRPLFEVLLRLQEEEENMLPPGGFFPIAERYGLMEEIDRWVVRSLLRRCAAGHRDDPAWRAPLYCVNICPQTLCDVDFPRYVAAELARHAVPAETLCFEIAEPDLLDHYRAVHALMHALKPLGCLFTADAFGSVKVSFALFRKLQFDFVKIDGTIIQNIVRERSDFAKVRAIALACRKLGVRTIAEFVESEDTLARLHEIGIDYAQGFGIGKPGPLE